MGSVFISYKSDSPDSHLAHAIAEYLRSESLQPWLSATLTPGRPWAEAIEHELQTMTAFIVLLSTASVQSEIVLGEVQRACLRHEQDSIPIIPVPLDLTRENLPLPFAALKRFQWCDGHISQLFSSVRNGLSASTTLLHVSSPGPPSAKTPSAPAPQRLLVTTDASALESAARHEPPAAPEDGAALPLVGGLRPGSTYYVRRALDGDVDGWLRRRELAGTIALLGGRQTGKTSLMLRLYGEAKADHRPAVKIDFQALELEHINGAVIARTIARQVARALTAPRPFEIGPYHTPYEALREYVEEQLLTPSDTPALVLFDEVDRVVASKHGDDFLHLMRAWHEKAADDPLWRKWRTVLAFARHPGVGAGANGSPLDNVAHFVDVVDFSRGELDELNKRYGSRLQAQDLDAMFDLLNGHPYLTGLSFHYLTVKGLAFSELCTDEQGGSIFLEHLRARLVTVLRRDSLRRLLREVLDHGTCSDDMAFETLAAEGLVVGKRRACQPRCKLYRTYFEAEL